MEEGGDTVPLLPSPVDHGTETEAGAGTSEEVADGTSAGNDDDDDDDLLNVAVFTYPNVYVSY